MPDETIPKSDFAILMEEIRMAEARNEQELEPQMREALERFTGVHVPDIAVDWSIILNEIYPIIQYNLPSIFFRNPRVFLKPRNKFFIAKRRDPLSGKMEEVQLDAQKSANTQSAILNYHVSQQNRYKQETRFALLDSLLFKHGVLWHGYKGDFGVTDEQSIYIRSEQVFTKRLSPLKFIFDPSVNLVNLDEGRWVGRIVDIPLVDLLEDDKLDVDKSFVKGVPGFGDVVGTKDLIKEMKLNGTDYMKAAAMALKPLIKYAGQEFQDSPYSRFVRTYEIFQRPSPKERRAGSKGRLILSTFEQNKPLRTNKWPYKGAEGWPSKILMFNHVPDQSFGMSDLAVYSGEADHKNLVINQQIRNAETLNKVWVGVTKEGMSNEEDVDKIQKGQSSVVFFDEGNPREKMFVASAAGASSSELYTLDQRIDRSLQDKSGVTDLKRGFLQSGEESAASVKIRNAGSSARPAYRQDLMADFLKESMTYLNQLLKEFTPYRDAVRIVGSLDLEWTDQFSPEEIQAEVDVDIDVISMLPEDPQRELQELGEVLRLMVEALTTPVVIQKINQEGKTLNLAPVIEQMLLRLRIRDPDVFRGIRPEESEGFVAVAELRAAQANATAAIQGSALPSPPAPGQDHRARLSLYSAIAGLLRELGQVSDQLEQLMELQTALQQEEEEKENAKVGQKVNGRLTPEPVLTR